MKTVTLTPKSRDVITNFGNDLVVHDVTEYRVGNKLIWIEYNGGKSIIAVKRSDYHAMRVDESVNVPLYGEGFERINCKPYSNVAETVETAEDDIVEEV